MDMKKKAAVAILISDKIDCKTKAMTRDKEGHCIILKGIVQQEDITLVNMYAPKIGAPKLKGNSWRTLRRRLTKIQSS